MEIRITQITISAEQPLYTKGHECYCGYTDWIIKPKEAVCSNCGRKREGSFGSDKDVMIF